MPIVETSKWGPNHREKYRDKSFISVLVTIKKELININKNLTFS